MDNDQRGTAAFELVGLLLMLLGFAGLTALLAWWGGTPAALLPAAAAVLGLGYRMATGSAAVESGSGRHHERDLPAQGRYSDEFDPEDPRGFLPQ